MKRAFGIFQRRGFAWYFAAVSISNIGSTMAPVALTFAVLEITHSGIGLGVVLAAHTLPMLALLLLGGVIGDRSQKAAVILWGQAIAGASQGVAAILLITGRADIWMLAAIQIVNGSATGLTLPAFQGIIPSLVAENEIQQASTVVGTSRYVLAVAGPAIGGVLVPTAGAGWAIAIDAMTWFVSFACTLRIPKHSETVSEPEVRASVTADLLAGWMVLKSQQWIGIIIAAFCILNFINAGAFDTLGPLSIATSLGATGWGLILSTQALGLVASTVFFLTRVIRYPLRVGMLGAAITGILIIVLGLYNVAPGIFGIPDEIYTIAFAAGFGIGICSNAWQTLLLEKVDSDVLARVISWDYLVSLACVPIGQILYGFLAEKLDVSTVMIVSGSIYAIVACLTLISNQVRNLSRSN
jgi:MFS family permease